VLLTHSVVFYGEWPAIHWASGNFIRHAGYFGVIFFYVLSGFLITYLLLVEKDGAGHINVRRFYKRRMLRIWPLYYFIIILSFFILPHIWPWKQPLKEAGYSDKQVLLYVLFLPNLAAYIGPIVPTCFQTYTIGFEEQFYLGWPLVIRAGRKLLIWLLTALFIGHFLLEMLHLYLVRQTPGQHHGIPGIMKICLTFINYSNLPAFIAGGFAGWIFLYGVPRLLAWIRGRIWTYLLPVCILIMMCCADVQTTGFVNILSIAYAWLILNLVLRNAEMGKLQTLLTRGGEISYGIYIYHPAVFILVSGVLKRAFSPNLASTYFLYLGISFLLVIMVSSISYRYLERPFLRRKYTLEEAGGQQDDIRGNA
jgi:peptidoglycan/LPS O-acetylase OafA/YrhL